MAYKLVCVDIDGTLLNSKHKITEGTKASLLQAYQLGVEIVISTGRMYTDAKYYSNLIGVPSPVIASNGAFIKGKGAGEVIYKAVFGAQLSLELLEIFRKHDITPYFCTPHKFYYGNVMFKLVYLATTLLGKRRNKLDIEYVFSWNRWREVLEQEQENIVKSEIIYRNPARVQELRKELRQVAKFTTVDSSKYNVEITRRGTSKGKAVEILATLYGLQREEIICIGDSENDLSMIEYAGLGIAMGNSSPLVKEKADYITDSNDDDGVANAINKFVLGHTL